MIRCGILLVWFFCGVDPVFGQEEDLLAELESKLPEGPTYVLQTFKGTRLVNGHTVEAKAKGDLEFIFMHRFGPVSDGLYELYGLDDAYVRLGIDYGFTDRLSASIGRNSVDKTLDGYLKYRIARQQTGSQRIPVTVTALLGTAYKASPRKNAVPEGFANVDRLAYVMQLLVARKVNQKLSLQVMPVFIHKNAVNQEEENNDQLAIGLGGRYSITPSIALTGEYYFRPDVPPSNPYYNTAGLGVEIETGGHVFQLVLTNTRGLTERAFITESSSDFSAGDIHFGFNVTRAFRLKNNR